MHFAFIRPLRGCLAGRAERRTAARPAPALRQVVVALIGLVLMSAAPVSAAKAAGSASRVIVQHSGPSRELLAFRGGGFHLGGGFLGRRRYGGGSYYGRSYGRGGTLRRVAHTLFTIYLLHLFFSHGGLSILLWVVIIGIVLHLARRRRGRRAYPY